MGNKWSNTAITGYGAADPADDGSAVASNKVTYRSIKTNLTNPLNSSLTVVISNLNDLFSNGTVAKSGSYTTTTSDHTRVIEVTGTNTITLLEASSGGAGYEVTVKNAGTGLVTVARSASNTIDGATSVAIFPQGGRRFIVNAASDGYNSIGVPPTGSIVQTAEGTPYVTYTDVSTVIPGDDSIPQSGEGTQLTTVTLTPTKTTSRLVIEWECIGTIGATGFGTAAIFQDATANALAATCVGAAGGTTLNLSGRYEMAAGTASSTTFKLRAGPSTGASNLYINGSASSRLMGGAQAARLRVTEYA